MGLHIVLKRETTGLNLSRCSRPDTQISISVRMSIGNKSNNDACEGLSCFEWICRVLLRRCMLRGDANNSRGCFLVSACPHHVFLVKSRGIVMFSEIRGVFMKDVTFFCVLTINVCINCSESHMAGFIGGVLCTDTYGCTFVCIVV